MSGQPVNTKAQQAKFLDEYMENLALQAELDKQNFEANRIYKQTGQLPAVSSMPDNRSVEEKLGDVETLKKGIIDDVGKIISPHLASLLVGEIQKSKFNTDNSLLRFFAQRAPEFMRELEKKYKYGLKDMNDIVSTVKFIEKYFTEAQDSFASIKDIAGRNQRDEDRILNRDLFKVLGQEILGISKTLLLNRDIPTTITQTQVDTVVRKLNELYRISPHPLSYETFVRNFISNYAILSREPGNPDYETMHDALKVIQDYDASLKELSPEKNFLIAVNSGIKKTIDSNLTTEAKINKIVPLFQALERELQKITQPDIEKVHRMAMWIEGFRQENTDLIRAPVEAGRAEALALPGEGAYQPLPYEELPSERFLTPEELEAKKQRSREKIEQESGGASIPLTREEQTSVPASEVMIDTDNQLLIDLYQSYLLEAGDLGLVIPIELSMSAFMNASLVGRKDLIKTLEDVIESRKSSMGVSESKGHGLRRMIRGRGISKPFVSRIDRSAGIYPSPEYVPFGSYLLNRRKIGEGIISIKTSKGSNVVGFPNRRISEKLSTVFRKIAGGSLPSFDELANLDEEEKEYLHKVSKKANLLDKLSIPSPSKDQQEKDIHNFEVMKGEIMSGNDNKDLVKKFKLIVLKLKNQGLLPKAQADDILSDLTSIGY